MARKKQFKKPEGQEDQWRTPQKRMRKQGVFHEQPKSATVNLCLTPNAKTRLKEIADLNKLSMSEFLERWLTGQTENLELP